MAKIDSPYIETREALGKFEQTSLAEPKRNDPLTGVSKKYVPILSTEIVDILAPEFEFTQGVRYYNYNSAHSIHFEYKGNHIALENSYDRSRAFSFKLLSNWIALPLDLERQIHLGENAKALTPNFKINKSEISEAISTARTIVNKLKSVSARPEFKAEIENIVFKTIKERKGFLDITFEVGSQYDTVYKYINEICDTYINGHYIYREVVNGETKNRKARKSNSNFMRLQMTNKVYAYLYENYIEAFI